MGLKEWVSHYLQAISTRDIIRVMRLVRETCELGDDAVEWRRHFIEGLRNLVDKGMYGIAAVLRQPVDPTNFDIPLQFWVGLDAQRVQIWDRYVMEGYDVSPDPSTPAILAFGASDFTRRARTIVHGSPMVWVRITLMKFAVRWAEMTCSSRT